MNGPTGTAEWDSEITEDEPGRRISWASLPDASVDNAGTVEFKPAPEGRGTEVRALISFKPPMGGAGRMVAGWMQKDPHIQAKRDLRRFKQLIEDGRGRNLASQSRQTRFLIRRPQACALSSGTAVTTCGWTRSPTR